jgi:hypothetical protein
MENSDLPLDGFDKSGHARLHAQGGEYQYVFEDQIPSLEAAGWICVGTMPGHHAERGWIVWRPE